MIILIVLISLLSIVTAFSIISYYQFRKALEAFDHLIFKFVESNQKFYDIQLKQHKQLNDAISGFDRIFKNFSAMIHKHDQIVTESKTNNLQMQTHIQTLKTSLVGLAKEEVELKKKVDELQKVKPIDVDKAVAGIKTQIEMLKKQRR